MAYTGTGDVSSDTAAFQQLAYFAFRSQPMYEMIADVRSTAQTHNGASVQFNIYDNMAQATSALTEESDVTAVALGASTVVVTLAEYGNAVITTAKLRGPSFLNVDADAANIIGYNMVDSVDKLVSNVANAGTNVIYALGSAGSRPTSRGAVSDASTFGAQEGRPMPKDRLSETGRRDHLRQVVVGVSVQHQPRGKPAKPSDPQGRHRAHKRQPGPL